MKKRNDYLGELITFISAFVALIIIFKLNNVFDKTIMISDLKAQEYPLIEYLRNNSFSLFDLHFGMGDSIIGTLLYYVMSPFNILVLFIKDLNIFFIFTVIIKSSLAGVFCYKFIKYQFKKEKIIYFVLFSLLYSLSSYFISYSIVVEFLDVYMLFPLLLFGIDKIINENKNLLFIITLILIIISNYYFSYMILIFSFIYFNYKTILITTKKNELLNKNLHFLIISFLTCLTLSFILIPIISEIGLYSHNNNIIFGGEGFNLLFNIKDIFNHYIIGNFKGVEVTNYICFYVYTSIIVIPLIYFYFINSKFKKKEKILTAIMLIILLLSIGINYINYIWHGFIPPSGFNGRFTFMFILFLILISIRSLYYLKQFKKKHYFIALSLIYIPLFLFTIIEYPRWISIDTFMSLYTVYIFIVLSSLFVIKDNKTIKNYIIYSLIIIILISIYVFINKLGIHTYIYNLFLSILSSIILSFINKKHDLKIYNYFLIGIIIFIPISLYSIIINYKLLGTFTIFKLFLVVSMIILLKYLPKNKKLIYVLGLLIVIELLFNGYHYLSRFKFKKIDNSYEKVVEKIKEHDKSKFYRIENNLMGEGTNNALLYDYYGIDYFMSTIKKDYVNFFKKLYVNDKSKGNNSINYDGSYQLISSLLNVKYYIETNNLSNNQYKKIGEESNYQYYLNEECLELGYVVNSKIKDIYKSDNGLDYINNIYRFMTNNDSNVLNKIELNKINNKKYYFNNTSDKDIYILVDIKQTDEDPVIDLLVNGQIINNDNFTYLYRVNNIYDLDTINIELKGPKNSINRIIDVYAYYYNDDIYKEDINILKENELKITNIKNSKIEGIIDSKEDNILFVSIPYNKDLEIYVDNKKQDKLKLLDTFIGTELTKGKHKITIQYKPTNVYISIIPSFIGIVLLVTYLRIRKKRN